MDDKDIEVCEVELVVPEDGTNDDSDSVSSIEAAMEGVTAVVISIGTTAFPTSKWKGGNTPKAIDKDAVTRIANAASKPSSVQKVVLVTSVGVERTNQMPFMFLNLFGVVDAKKDGDDAIIRASSSGTGYDYVTIRPGRLIGGPFTNYDVA